ncbi:hypothetical protein Gohar_016852 [Gossypium harknessii]|uniref:Uncharacterized protein n=1 Tax=Gossypium harknessii TaxID=34285 RepID=A0A7J9G5B9_9ROSI|nr:hypothetical protein [Gossypium harknessii]
METQNFSNDTDRDPCTDGDQNTKKVRFKEAVDGEATNMVVDSGQQLIMSFKDKLLKGGVDSSDGNLEGIFGKNECDFELPEGDVNMSMVNGFRQSPSRIASRKSWSMDHIRVIPYSATVDEKRLIQHSLTLAW